MRPLPHNRTFSPPPSDRFFLLLCTSLPIPAATVGCFPAFPAKGARSLVLLPLNLLPLPTTPPPLSPFFPVQPLLLPPPSFPVPPLALSPSLPLPFFHSSHSINSIPPPPSKPPSAALPRFYHWLLSLPLLTSLFSPSTSSTPHPQFSPFSFINNHYDPPSPP